MAEKILNTIMQLRYDTYANWTTKNPILKKGEVAFATLENNAGDVCNAPSVIIKVGDGVNKYSNLKIVSGLAADVYEWAKASSKPSYAASEIDGLSDYIGSVIEDTDTQYQIVVDSTNTDDSKIIYKLQSKAKGAENWENVSTFTVPTEDGVSSLIDTAISNLELADTYDAKGAASAVQSALDEYKTANNHSVSDIKSIVDNTKETLDTFLADADVTTDAVDTLKEIQEYITSDGKAAAEVTGKISALEVKAHEHSNKSTLDGITNAKITTWDASEENAKGYADSLATNYATAAQGLKADSALQNITTTSNGGLKVTGNNQIDIDDETTFIFNCGDAFGNPL